MESYIASHKNKNLPDIHIQAENFCEASDVLAELVGEEKFLNYTLTWNRKEAA